MKYLGDKDFEHSTQVASVIFKLNLFYQAYYFIS